MTIEMFSSFYTGVHIFDLQLRFTDLQACVQAYPVNQIAPH